MAAARARDVLTLIPEGVEVSCLGRTKGDAPKHPLYLRADTARVPFGGVREGQCSGRRERAEAQEALAMTFATMAERFRRQSERVAAREAKAVDA